MLPKNGERSGLRNVVRFRNFNIFFFTFVISSNRLGIISKQTIIIMGNKYLNIFSCYQSLNIGFTSIHTLNTMAVLIRSISLCYLMTEYCATLLFTRGR